MQSAEASFPNRLGTIILSFAQDDNSIGARLGRELTAES
jgi:hypothetical protein